jgi:hypothetical protein
MNATIPRGPSGTPDQPSFRNDPPLTSGLEIWLNGTHAELDVALSALDAAGRVLWRSQRQRLHGHGDAGRHSVHLRLAVTENARPARTHPPPAATGELIDLDAARHQRATA